MIEKLKTTKEVLVELGISYSTLYRIRKKTCDVYNRKKVKELLFPKRH